MRRALFAPIIVVATFALGACGGSDTPEPFADPEVAPHATNPDGVPYPTTNIGTTPRHGDYAGSTVPNLAFQGYPRGDRSAGLQVVSLADYYDPKAMRHKVLLITAAASWCESCVDERKQLEAAANDLAAGGAVFLTALVQGHRVSIGPSLGELDAWVTSDPTPSTFDVVVDNSGKRLVPLGALGVPWNALIDTRTMELLRSDLGAPDDPAVYVRSALTFVNTHPLK